MSIIRKQQKEYYNRIQNSELKKLLQTSYYFLSMTDEQKLDFLIWLSLVHKNKIAESDIIQSLKDEKNDIRKAFNDEKNYRMSEKEAKRQDEIIQKELAIFKKKANELEDAIEVVFAKNPE